MMDQKAEGRSESMGYMGREVGDPRDSNPYAKLFPHTALESKVLRDLAAAWWRGWDRADAVLKMRGPEH